MRFRQLYRQLAPFVPALRQPLHRRLQRHQRRLGRMHHFFHGAAVGQAFFLRQRLAADGFTSCKASAHHGCLRYKVTLGLAGGLWRCPR